MSEELRAALDTALRVVLHETLDPKCEGTPPYDETAAMAERVLRTPVVAAALSQPRQEDGLDVERLARALRTDAVRDIAVHYEPERAAQAIAAEYARVRAADEGER